MAIKIGTDLVSCINQATNGAASTINDNVWYDSKNNKLKTYLGEIPFDKTKKLIPKNTNFSDSKYIDVGTSSTNPSWKDIYVDGKVSVTLSSGFSFYDENIVSFRLSENLYFIRLDLNCPNMSSSTSYTKLGTITKINGSNLSIPSSAKKNSTNGAGYITEFRNGDAPYKTGVVSADNGGGIYFTLTNNHGAPKYATGRFFINMFITFSNNTEAQGKAL